MDVISNLYHHPWAMLQCHPTLGKVNRESVLESIETSTLLNFGIYFGHVDPHSAMVFVTLSTKITAYFITQNSF